MTESGRLLRDARQRSGLSQRELAGRTGVPQSLISAYERGRRQPGADMLLRLVRGTGYALQLTTSVDASRPAAKQLELVCAMAMALPARPAGPLQFPHWKRLTS